MAGEKQSGRRQVDTSKATPSPQPSPSGRGGGGPRRWVVQGDAVEMERMVRDLIRAERALAACSRRVERVLNRIMGMEVVVVGESEAEGEGEEVTK